MKTHVTVYSLIALAILAAGPTTALAHETDQFSNRADPIADSTEPLNEKVNQAIARVARKHHDDKSRKVIVNALFDKLGSRFLVDRLEGWAIKSPAVEKLQTGRFESVYSKHPIWATRVTSIFGVGETIRVK